MDLVFDHNYQFKYMCQSFKQPLALDSVAAVLKWRAEWMGALKSWHSPYKVLVDCQHLSIPQPCPAEVTKALQTMVKFFEGLFLRQIVGFGFDPAKGHEALPFTVVGSEAEARSQLGLRDPKDKAPATSFRDAITLQNHFRQHVVEMGFSAPVTIAGPDQIDALKSKLTNNLMQWHSKWSLMIDCANLDFADGQKDSWLRLERYLRGFFMKSVIGYSPKAPKESYPFEVFRARHNAAARLESEGNFSGDDADCKSRKS